MPKKTVPTYLILDLAFSTHIIFNDVIELKISHTFIHEKNYKSYEKGKF